jgi:hypothetical protein
VGGRGAVGKKPFEGGNNMPFQGHRCPGPDFNAEKGKNALFSPKMPTVKGFFFFLFILSFQEENL